MPAKTAEAMPGRTRHRTINRQKYAQLVAASLPIPPLTEEDNERLIWILSALDVREDLTAEEAAFADLLASSGHPIAAQGVADQVIASSTSLLLEHLHLFRT